MLSWLWKKVCSFKEGSCSAFFLLPLLMVTCVPWTLLRAPSGHWKPDITTNVTAGRDLRGAIPVAELVSCVNCSSSAPGVDLVWRKVSNEGHEMLLEYPDLLMDAYAIWNRCPKLTVLVTSEPERRAQRHAIRTTWGRRDLYSNCSHRVIFFMSAVPRSKQYYALKAEYRNTKDIVVQARTGAAREPTWSMSALLVEWVPTHVSGSSFVLRVTDDTYVNVPALLSALENLTSSDDTPVIYGRSSSNQTHLEDCAYMAKSEGFMRLQRSFADVALNHSDGPLVTGRLAHEAGLALVHMKGFGSCDDRRAALTARKWLRKGTGSSSHLTVRGISPALMTAFHEIVSKLEFLEAE